tara:strand:+ start:965 stop:1171 length:207 start_codon:yes stop_codon:yes gene_type:complete
MDVGATNPVNQISWRQVAEQKYQRLMDDLQVEERKQRVEQLNTTLYIAKNNKIQLQSGKAPNNINFLV